MAFRFKMLKNIEKRISNLRLSLPLAQKFFSDNSECKDKSSCKIFPKLMFARPVTHSLFIPSQNMHQVPRNFCRNFTSDSGKGTLTSGYNSESNLEDNAENSRSTLDVENSTSMLDVTFETKSCLSDSEWEEVLDIFMQNPYFEHMTCYDGLVMKRCVHHGNLALANSYLRYLETQNSKPNLLALAYYLRLCANLVEECGEDKVLEVYKQLCREAKIFDATLSEYAILALTKTSEWRQAFKHLPGIRKLANVNMQVYSALMIASFKNGEYDTGWQLLDTVYREGKEPSSNILLEWIKQCELGENQEAMMNTLLHKLRLYDFYVKVPVAEEIMKFYRKNLEWSGRYVKISNSGSCPACNHSLEPIELDEEAFRELQEKFMSRVLLGSDIYKTTSPEEWSRFRTFMECNGPFTTVIDGLNVAYTSGSGSFTGRMRRLREVVMEIKKSNSKKDIIVIVRKHMEFWSEKELHAIKASAKVFTLDNHSKDDGFFIYAALQSGDGCQFVTCDLLRDHLYRLGDLSLRETFRQWQRKHQIFVVSHPLGMFLVPPPAFKATTQSQSAADAWHIPYNDGSIQESFQVPCTWLCLQSIAQNHEGHHPKKFVSENVIEHSKGKSTPHLRNPKQFRPKPTSRVFNAEDKNIEYGRIKKDKKYQTHSQFTGRSFKDLTVNSNHGDGLRNFSNKRKKMREDIQNVRKSSTQKKVRKYSKLISK